MLEQLTNSTSNMLRAFSQSSSTGGTSYESSDSIPNLSLWVTIGASFAICIAVTLNSIMKRQRAAAVNQQPRRGVVESKTEVFSAISEIDENNDDVVQIHIAAPR